MLDTILVVVKIYSLQKNMFKYTMVIPPKLFSGKMLVDTYFVEYYLFYNQNCTNLMRQTRLQLNEMFTLMHLLKNLQRESVITFS